MTTQPCFLLWGFDEDGNPYVDGIGIGETLEKYCHYATLRERFQVGLRRAVLHVPIGITAEEICNYVESGKHPDLRADVIAKLRAAGANERETPTKLKVAMPETFLDSLRSL